MENNGYFKPESINLDGFSVVERQAFTRGVIVGPKMTLWKDSLAFSADCVKMLNRCDCVQMLVNKETRMIAIRAVPSSAPNSIQWINQKGTGKKKDCIKFCSEMFLFMGWDENFKYRADVAWFWLITHLCCFSTFQML